MEMESDHWEAYRLFSQGCQQCDVGELQEALQSWEAAAQLYRKSGGDPVGEVAVLCNQGVVYRNLGQYQRVIELYEQVLVVARESGNRLAEGEALGNLGFAYLQLKQYPQSINHYEQQLVIAREWHDLWDERDALLNLGIAYGHLKQFQQAIECYERMLVIVRETGYRQEEGNALGSLGVFHAASGRYSQAIELLQQSVTVRESIRQGLRSRDRTLEQSYVDSVAVHYRLLASLLQQDNRETEAQQVLALLNVP